MPDSTPIPLSALTSILSPAGLGVGTSGATGTSPVHWQDRFGRVKRKLRISLTDRCNFRCPYCLPANPQWLPKDDLLTASEWQRLIGVFVGRGITDLRLTGGEPLLRKDLEEFVTSLQPLRARGLKRVAMTTNASRLAHRVGALRTAGLDDLNISLDSLDTERFARLSGGGRMADTLAGIEASLAAGFRPKLNAVLMRGENEAEAPALLAFARARGLTLRFIEFMPLDNSARWNQERVVAEAEVRQMLAAAGETLTPRPGPPGADPARYWQSADGTEVGFISTVTDPFCGACDRLRLTADGRLYACLFGRLGLDLRSLLRGGAGDAEISSAIAGAVWAKDAGYAATAGGYQARSTPVSMHALGG